MLKEYNLRVILKDWEIDKLITERKNLPLSIEKAFRNMQTTGRGYRRKKIELQGEEGSRFAIMIRQNTINPLDFSIILGYYPPNSSVLFRLRRYNGEHGQHTNKIESNQLYSFHIQKATERYQVKGFDEEGFAEKTNEFYDLRTAFLYMIKDCSIRIEETEPEQTDLF